MALIIGTSADIKAWEEAGGLGGVSFGRWTEKNNGSVSAREMIYWESTSLGTSHLEQVLHL